MNRSGIVAISLSICWLATGSAASANLAKPSLTRQVKAVVSHLVGVMDTTAQAAKTPEAPSVQMTTCRVRVSPAPTAANPATIYLYQEQALTRSLEKPYRQRFLRIAPNSASQSIQSLTFELSSPETWAGLCRRSESERVIPSEELGKPICSLFLRHTDEGYIGRTPVDGCPTDARGAVRITNLVILHEAGMDTWDRGFNQHGQQVWGATTEPYRFRWVRRSPD